MKTVTNQGVVEGLIAVCCVALETTHVLSITEGVGYISIYIYIYLYIYIYIYISLYIYISIYIYIYLYIYLYIYI